MKTALEKFQELQKKSQSIIQGAVQINTKIETARENYEKLAAIVQEKYGTADIDELENILEDWEKENEEKLEKYENEISSLEQELNEKRAPWHRSSRARRRSSPG